MVAITHTATLIGVEARPIEVEVELAQGLPLMSIIGLGDTAVHEAKYRILAALRAAGIELPQKKITINLAPAGIRKDGAALDLPMALGILSAADILQRDFLRSALIVGELALSGDIRPIRGALAVASMAKSFGFKTLVVPLGNHEESSALEGLEVISPKKLGELISHLRGEATIVAPPPVVSLPQINSCPDLADVRGQPLARRALELAAAGGHNLLMVGPPGGGKTMLARRIPSILPELTMPEQLEVTKVWSAAGLTLSGRGLIRTRPFRAPHHSASEAALIGGGSSIRPGEVSLAHRGVLFLDELPEFPRRTLESLRQPMEDREVLIARARHVVRLPAAFMLVAAANPCPCGWFGDSSGRCRCDLARITNYARRLSGPLLDRTDLIIQVPAISAQDLLNGPPGEASEFVRERVTRVRRCALERGVSMNAQLSGENLRAKTAIHPQAAGILFTAVEKLRLSARVVDRTLRVARTIADLEGRSEIDVESVAEALSYRPPADWTSAAMAA